jgi:streptomycin 6-kinase
LLQRSPPGRILARRAAIFSEMLAIDAERIVGWVIAQAVLSGRWSFEDHGHGWETAMRCAELLGTLSRNRM